MALRDTRRTRAWLDEQMRQIAFSLCESPASSMEEYMKRVGRYLGFKETKAELGKEEDADDDSA